MFGRKKEKEPKIYKIKCPYCEKLLEELQYDVVDDVPIVGCPYCNKLLGIDNFM